MSVILKQLGGSKFAAMVGAKSFSGDDSYLSFRIGRNAKRIKAVQIKLKGNDLYDMEFLNIHDFKVKVVDKYSDLYADQLVSVFGSATGLYASL